MKTKFSGIFQIKKQRNNIGFSNKLLAQRPITLVLMMINSCSYSTNDLVLFKFQICLPDLNWSLVSTKYSKSSFKTSMYRFKSSSINIISRTQDEVYLEGIKFRSSLLEKEDLQEDLYLEL